MSGSSSEKRGLVERYNEFCIRLTLEAEKHANLLLLVLGIGLIVSGSMELSLAQDAGGGEGGDTERYDQACNRLLGLLEGPFGALVTVAAGVGAVIASAVGGFKMAWTLVVVSVGAFILRSYVTLFFKACGGGGGGAAP